MSNIHGIQKKILFTRTKPRKPSEDTKEMKEIRTQGNFEFHPNLILQETH